MLLSNTIPILHLLMEKERRPKSVISILAAGIKCGDEIELIADGPDEQEALENVAAAFKESLKD